MNPDPIYKQRLLKLADFLEALPPEKFDYGTWSNKCDGDLNACGTTACALGWATAIPEFRELGLRLYKFDPEGPGGPGIAWVGLKGRSASWQSAEMASEEVFGLDYREHNYLFVPDFDEMSLPETASAKTVAERIRLFVQNGMPDREDFDDEYE